MRAIVFAALILTGCAQAAGSPVQQTAPLSPVAQRVSADLARLDQELRAPGVAAAGINETADLGGGLTVTPLQVIEDSRCPNNVECIWAGRLRLRASVSGQDVEMTLGEPTQTTHGVVMFAVVKPSPWAHWPTEEIGPPPAHAFGFRRG